MLFIFIKGKFTPYLFLKTEGHDMLSHWIKYWEQLNYVEEYTNGIQGQPRQPFT